MNNEKPHKIKSNRGRCKGEGFDFCKQYLLNRAKTSQKLDGKWEAQQAISAWNELIDACEN